MSNYWWWLILSEVTGNPILALVLLFVGGWALDQFTLGILPSPLRLLRRYRRAGQLERELSINPHNRKSRFELADLYLDQRRPKKALEVLKPNVAAGDDDAATLYLMGRAAFGSGFPDQGETFLTEGLERDPEYRLGAIWLELGRGRLDKGDAAGARAALEEFCKRRKGTVEGKVLLARACEAGGEGNRAAQLRRDAWADYASSPRFVQRQERWWAWRIQPWRPVALGVAAIALGVGAAHFAPNLRGLAGGRRGFGLGALGAMARPGMTAQQQAKLQALLATPTHPGGGPIDPKRFVRLPAAEAAGTAHLRGRWNPYDTSAAGRQKAQPGDMLCRLWRLYGKPDGERGAFSYVFRDTANGSVITAYSAGSGPAYGTRMLDAQLRPLPDLQKLRAQAELSVGALDQLLDETQPMDCSWQFQGDEGAYESGVRGGEVFTVDE